MPDDDQARFVSRAGAKLAFALNHFDIAPKGWVCADLGSHVGGFVDCLLQHHAQKVYSIDTSNGTLDWSLRNNARVVVMERTNAMHLDLPETVRLITVDVGWTRQQLVLPRAVDAIDDDGLIISLIKPHYEADPAELKRGRLPDESTHRVVRHVVDRLAELDIHVKSTVESPIRGSGGNREFLALIQP